MTQTAQKTHSSLSDNAFLERFLDFTGSVRYPGISALVVGFGCTLASLQSIRITTLIGIYPVEISLILRHALSALIILIVALILLKHKEGMIFESKAFVSLICILCTVALFSKYSNNLLEHSNDIIVSVGKVAEECFAALMFLVWAKQLLKQSLKNGLSTLGFAICVQACIQFILSFVQREACMFAVSILPLFSLFAFILYQTGVALKSGTASISGTAPISGTATSEPIQEGADYLVRLHTNIPYALYFVIVFCASLIIGNILFDSLDTQQLRSGSAVYQLSIFLGNLIGGIMVLFFAKNLRLKSNYFIFLMTLFALCAVPLYLKMFLANETIIIYLALSSITYALTNLLLFYIPYLFLRHSQNSFTHFAIAYVAFWLAKTTSAIFMNIDKSYLENSFDIVGAITLIILLICCIYLLVKFASQIESPAPSVQPSEKPITDDNSKPAPFRQAIDQIAQEYHLTAQEAKILPYLAKGQTAGLIAEEMVVSVNTTKTHVRSIYNKLDLHSQQELIAFVETRKEANRNRF